jgi:UDP-N-acetylmuramoyl-tripeptide--D-alanyl-D-alanine ligase
MPLGNIAEACGGEIAAGDPALRVTSVSTDTRTLRPGALFVALAGEKFDAHDFLEAAALAGADAVLVHRVPNGGLPAGLPAIVVPDTLAALQQVARAYRRRLGIPGIAITGSSGKTSTKDMVAAVLGQRFAVRATTGNLNNHIGVPLTLLAMEDGDEVGVWEMGTNHPGEIAQLAAIAEPEFGVITNIGTAHIEFLGSRDAIAEEKGALVRALPPDGCAFLNADDPYTPAIAASARSATVTAGIGTGEVRAVAVAPSGAGSTFTLTCSQGEATVHLPVPGEHMVSNAVLAAAVGLHFGLDPGTVAAGLAAARLAPGRLQPRDLGGITFLDDSYNANPDSMRAALRTLAAYPARGQRVAVLGAMAEIGATSEAVHRDLGGFAARAGIDGLIVVGEEARPIADGAASSADGFPVEWYAGHQDAAGALATTASPGDVVLVKGSRAAHMELLIEEFARR